MKVGMISLGCPKNLVDSEVMLGLAEQAGHTLTSEAADAEVLIVNTCAFIDKSKQESINAILEMAELKKTGACRRLVVTGCLAERYKDELRDQIPGDRRAPGDRRSARHRARPGDAEGSDPFVPKALTAKGAVPMTLHRKPPKHQPLGGRAELPTYLYDAETPRRLATPGHYAYVKVAEGCDYTCAFCIIPRLRGHYRSRPAAEIVREAHQLASRGVKELLLISQDTTFYGNDLGERGALARLLRELNKVDGLEWIRLLYLYPTTIDDTMLEAMAESDKVCKYIDLPLQHASDAVLKRMKRPGTRQSYERLLTNIRTRMPGAALRTTFIVGFPGETEADVAELEGFLDTVRFDHVGIFTYSHEEGHDGRWLGRRRAGRDEAEAPGPADGAPAGDCRRGPAGPDWQPRPAGRRRPVSRARTGAARPPVDPGPGHRPAGLPHRMRPLHPRCRAVSGGRSGRRPRLRPGRPSVAVVAARVLPSVVRIRLKKHV